MTLFASSPSSPWVQAATCPIQPQPAIRIVSATVADLEGVALLLTESFHPVQRWNAWLRPWLARGIGQDLRHRLQYFSDPYTCLLAYQEISGVMGKRQSVLVGTIELSGPVLRFQDQPYCYVSNLAVRANYRRQGIGRQLLHACGRQAQTVHAAGLYLHVLKGNETARLFYQAQGFETPLLSGLQGLRRRLPSRRILLAKPL